MQQRLDAQDLREVVEAFPQCRVETVSDKTTVGYTGGGRRGRWGRKSGGMKFDVKVEFAK